MADIGYIRERHGPFIRKRVTNYADLITREDAHRPGPGRYDLPDLMSRPMPRRIKPDLSAKVYIYIYKCIYIYICIYIYMYVYIYNYV